MTGFAPTLSFERPVGRRILEVVESGVLEVGKILRVAQDDRWWLG